MTKNWTLQLRKLSELKPYHKNARLLTKDEEKQLKTSIKKFGLIDKPIINKDNTLIGGHQRLQILKNLSIKEIECWVPELILSDQEIEELNIRLNRNNGQWDWDKLANEWDTQKLLEFGFNEKDFQFDVETILPIDIEDETPLEPPKEPKTKLGDIYTLGLHRVMCGDSTNPDNVSSLLNGATPILMVADPPYGVNYDPAWRDIAGKGRRAKGKVKNDEQINWALAWFLFPGSLAYVWHAGKYCSEIQKSLEEAEFEIISQIIWVKQHFALSRGDYHWQHEPCWYAVKKGHKHNWQRSRKESTIWEIANLNCFGKSKEIGEERTAHGTQKPIECMARPIRNNTSEGESVYDPFLGSGTTLIAAEKLKRTCYGMELDPAYCDIIVQRWMKATNQIPLRNGIPVENL